MGGDSLGAVIECGKARLPSAARRQRWAQSLKSVQNVVFEARRIEISGQNLPVAPVFTGHKLNGMATIADFQVRHTTKPGA